MRVLRVLGIGSAFLLLPACGDAREGLGSDDGGNHDAAADDGGDGGGDAGDASVPPTANGIGVLPSAIDLSDTELFVLSEPVRVTLTNRGAASTLPLGITITGDDAEAFELWPSDACRGVVLAPDDTCSFDLTLTPSERREFVARLEITGGPDGLTSAPLSGTGYVPGALTPVGSGHDFGLVDVSAVSDEHLFTIVNQTDRPVPGVGYELVGSGENEFVVWTDTCSPLVAAGTTCTVGVRYVPKSPGPVEATLAIGGDVGTPIGFLLRGAGRTDETRTVTITLEGIAGASGVVTSVTSPERSPEIHCSGSCTHEFMLGSVVTLRAVADGGAFSGGWTGACRSATSTCTFTLDRNVAMTARFTPANRIFTSAGSYTLDELKARATETNDEMAKVSSGADAICRELGGEDFRAFIAREGAQIPAGVRGFVRADGAPFVTTLAPASARFSLPTLDEEGEALPAPAWLWSGITSLGSVGETCGGWDGAGTMVVGHAQSSDTLSHSLRTCAPEARMHLLCFEARYDAFVAPSAMPANARRIFVSTGTIRPEWRGGVVAADHLCLGEAATIGLPGNYRALLATDTATIASRFSERAAPIHRLDGVRVATSLASLFSSAGPEAPVTVRADGEVGEPPFVWTGSASATTPGASEDVCLDPIRGAWMGGTTGRIGRSTDLTHWLDAERIACGRLANVYCLEE